MALKPTTVRFVPDDATSADELAVAALHLYAYEIAASLVRPGSRVLDIGFGEGYGSRILADAGAEYLGIEVDPEIVEHARARYDLRFDTYDGTTINAPDSFDLVLAFQMIAYLDDPQPWLREVRRVLAPEGLALVTTPTACTGSSRDSARGIATTRASTPRPSCRPCSPPRSRT